MKYCKTCLYKHTPPEQQKSWQEFGISVCTRIPMFWNATEWIRVELDGGTIVRRISPKYANIKAFVQDGSDYQAYLLVADDFGCVMHEDT
jgi:hypothetical protein